MLIVLLSIAYFVLDKSDKKHQKSTEREKKEDIIVSDKFAEYIGGFPDVSGGKRAYITVKQNEIEIVLSPFANTIKKVIPMEVITNAEIKSESQITNEVTLGRMLLLGPLAFAFKKEKSIVKNYLVISCKKQDKEISLIFKTGSIMVELCFSIKNLGGENMATTVNNAFEEFMRDKVNLDQEKTKTARKSRDNLIDNIHSLNSNEDFFNLYNDIDIYFGSFGRRTKIRPLDDIDIMIGISGDGSTYYDSGNDVKIYVQNDDSAQKGCCNENTNVLNSTKVINKFISELKEFKDYKKAETHKNGAAVVFVNRKMGHILIENWASCKKN